MQEFVLVLGITSYNFNDEKTGRTREGAHIHYVTPFAFNESEKKGALPIKMSAPVEAFDEHHKSRFPAYCEIKTATVPDGKGKPVTKLIAVNYVKYAELFEPELVKK